ncbi:Enzymatic polyprotein [Eumeta japonica]|uniref:Enzymatic polyprotein n=1 Tax=Eumeta variegata TaxID=151549 RepID=A0A4C1TJ61_EUMVA|nr:Enzymatic polyprotein [Eumeta japonica]
MDKFQLRDEKSSNYIDAIISLRNQLRQPLPDYQHRSRYKISYRGVNKISYEDAGEQDDVIEEIRYNRHVNKPISTQEEGDDKRGENRRLNEQTVKDAYPLIYIDALLGRLQDTYFISSIDLKDAFWQILLAEDSKPKMAFTVPGRPHYHVTVMPFGL